MIFTQSCTEGISRDELAKLDKFFDLFTGLKDKLFKLNNNNYYELKIPKEDISSTINGELKCCWIQR
nr:hypothetical protein [Mycoplasmopsis bovis]